MLRFLMKEWNAGVIVIIIKVHVPVGVVVGECVVQKIRIGKIEVEDAMEHLVAPGDMSVSIVM